MSIYNLIYSYGECPLENVNTNLILYIKHMFIKTLDRGLLCNDCNVHYKYINSAIIYLFLLVYILLCSIVEKNDLIINFYFNQWK